MSSSNNELKVSPVKGEDVLLINGLIIRMFSVSDDAALGYRVYRKGVLVYSPDSLQDAVKWCQD